MSESYLALSHKEQRQILQSLSMNENIKRDALLLEKDIWICWALEFLFKMPNRPLRKLSLSSLNVVNCGNQIKS